MTKLELQVKRQKLIAKLTTVDNSERLQLQAEIAVVNAQIKALNIEEAVQAKRDADVKNALGKAEEQANLERAKEKAPPLPARVSVVPQQLTRGEYIIKTAKQLLRSIEKIAPANRLPHTLDFEQHLRVFVEAQKHHLRASQTRWNNKPAGKLEGLPLPPVEPSKVEAKWAETWEVGKVKGK